MSNALTMTGRSLRLSARSPEALLTALLLPVMLMVVFVYLFGGAVSIGTAYVDYVAPGVLLLCAVTGAATTAVTVCQDMAGGIIDRFRSLDVRGTVVLAGHVVAGLLRNLASTVLVVAVAIGIGFRPHASAAASPPRSACCCSSWPRSPGWPPRSACWSARPRRPTRRRSS
jgi:ABC-2 type transport system permease protein